MTDDELADYLRYLLDLQARDIRGSEGRAGARALFDVEPADLDRLIACLWASALSKSSRWSFAGLIPCSQCPFVGPMDCTDEELDVWVRELYCGCTDAEAIRSYILALVRGAVAIDVSKVPELFRLTNPANKVAGLEDMDDILATRLKTARAMAQRAATVGTRLAQEDETEEML